MVRLSQILESQIRRTLMKSWQAKQSCFFNYVKLYFNAHSQKKNKCTFWCRIKMCEQVLVIAPSFKILNLKLPLKFLWRNIVMLILMQSNIADKVTKVRSLILQTSIMQNLNKITTISEATGVKCCWTARNIHRYWGGLR